MGMGQIGGSFVDKGTGPQKPGDPDPYGQSQGSQNQCAPMRNQIFNSASTVLGGSTNSGVQSIMSMMGINQVNQ